MGGLTYGLKERVNMEQEKVQNVENTTENTVTQPVEENGGVFKTFKTEKDYQDAVNSLLKSKLPKKEEMDEFKKWQESKKTETEKQQEREKLIETLKKENNELKNLSVVANADVDKKFQKFVLSEISEMEGEFEDNLSNYLKDNPQFLISKEVTKTSEEDTGVPVTKVKTNAESGVTAILKEKHPELFK